MSKEDLINQSVTITDLVVKEFADNSRREYERSYGKGEWESNIDANELQSSKERSTAISQFCNHINLLANIANKYHEEKYFTSTTDGVKINHEDKNKITRLLLNEFSLYQKYKPFTVGEFKNIVQSMEKMASKLHENLHLMLATVPVMDESNRVYNFAIHIQCGVNPQFNIFAKSFPHENDPKYPNTTNYGYKIRTDEEEYFDLMNKIERTVAMQLPFDQKEELSAVKFAGVFKCQTVGGAEFFQGVDICQDHTFKVAKNYFEKDISLQIEDRINILIPKQISHIVVSASVDPIRSHGLSGDTHISIADTKVQYKEKNNSNQFNEDINQFPSNITDLSHGKTKVVLQKNKTIIENPEFGRDLIISAYQPHQLDSVQKSLADKIDLHNKSVKEKRYYGNFELFIALEEKDLNGLKLALHKGVDPTMINMSRKAPIAVAIENDYFEGVEILLKKIGEKDGLPILHTALKNNMPPYVIEYLLKKGVDPDLKDDVTPLLFAVYIENIEYMQLLLKYDADVNLASKNAWTPLYVACYKGDINAVKLLLDNNASVNPVVGSPEKNWDPLYIAANNGHKDIVEFLLERKANPNLPSFDGGTALHAAVQKDHLEVVKVLLKYGAKLDIKNTEGLTAYDIAKRTSNEVKSTIEQKMPKKLISMFWKNEPQSQKVNSISYKNNFSALKNN